MIGDAFSSRIPQQICVRCSILYMQRIILFIFEKFCKLVGTVVQNEIGLAEKYFYGH
jgi:hypothetical protein